MFRVGQKVTPKNDRPWEWEGDGCSYPQFGVVYTIRALEMQEDGLYLLLDEVRNEPCQFDEGFGEQNWEAVEFRPVVERKTDISVFTKMLTGKKVRALKRSELIQ